MRCMVAPPILEAKISGADGWCPKVAVGTGIGVLMMYKDEIWYRKLVQAVEEHREQLGQKQWHKYRVDLLLKIANRVREFSDGCETCRGYQHTLTRLEEEFQELPDSKAQRQYQLVQLRAMTGHFVEVHRLAAPGYFARKWLKLGMLAGLALGFLAMLVYGNLLLWPLGVLVGAGLAWVYGLTEDKKFEREHRLL